MNYKPRISDIELERKLNASGGVLIRGPKACGKTESACQQAKSILQVDQDPQVASLMESAPGRLLQGITPRLIDEWQEMPALWNLVRHEIDRRKKPAQFILTGSANPEETIKMHSGAGRFTIVDMRTMSWQELGISSGKIRLHDLFNGQKVDIFDEVTELEMIVDRLIIGGFPALINKKRSQAEDLNRAYIELLTEVDMSRVSNTNRDPIKVRSLLRSLARNTGTTVDISTLSKDIAENEKSDLTRPTIYDYIDVLERLMIIEDQPAWNAHIRSAASLRKNPKRHFTDVCLAIAILGVDCEALLNDLNFTGFLFESQVIHDLRIYAQANDARVFHYRDSYHAEVDAIVQKHNGDWLAFEIKLGTGQIDEAAKKLLKFADNIDTNKTKPPKSLNIITGTGISYTRNDGINVISIGSLGF
ncbi:MAG: ATP-binding protein [Saprospiraceae bacterium]|nr:MAG: ATPase AAA [Bacteroidetes bacterium OLB9]MCO6462521.1 ATP-binding protein [Saprospiraceae bacterium]MCZ2338235.1 DUF4143 domain-containing protein [Chitinophagales bacterium]